MHRVIVEELEDHLSGNASQAFREHLDACAACLAEISEIEKMTFLFREMQPPPGTVPEPRPDFFNGVARRIVDVQQKEAWGLFSPGALFFRRVAFACLLLLAGLGSFLVTRESAQGGADAAAIMAQHDATAVHAESADRDRLLVTLATYRQ